MASATLIPVLEYLNTTYRPDCDFVDGEVRERNAGEQPHSSIQIIVAAIFHAQRDAWQVRVLPEQRVQVTPTRYRIPDLCIVSRSDPKDPIILKAPLLCIEILSKDDSLRELQERVNDYSAMGVAHIWVIDPLLRIGYVAFARGFVQPESGTLQVEGTPIAVRLSEVVAELDEM